MKTRMFASRAYSALLLLTFLAMWAGRSEPPRSRHLAWLGDLRKEVNQVGGPSDSCSTAPCYGNTVQV